MFFCSIIGVLGGGLIFHASVVAIIIGFFMIHLEISTNDLMAESKYTEYIRDNPKTGTRIQSFVNGMNQLGNRVGVIIVGSLSDSNNFIPMFVIILLIKRVFLQII